ncbi:MAG: carboxylesterase family protein, partial [Bacteroidetes bacterium]|nr:carboxylesterase family protein [Bacteroidota bacterium]
MQFFYYNFAGGGVNAQETATTCNLSQLFCSVGPLDSGILNVADTPLTRTYYKSLTPAGYSDVHYKLNYCPFTCPVPNNPTGCDNTADALYYYVYYPTNYPNYNTCPLPALILFHSGGFSECSSPDQDGLDYFCRAMASRGFVVFSVSYRVGILADRRNIPGTPPPPPSHQNDPKWQYVSAQQILGIYRAVQDARGAIRSIIKRQVNETSGDTWNDPYRIDTNYVFVDGMSAGSHIAMNSAYYPTQTMINKVFPNVSTALGGIDPDFYYAAPPATGDDDYFHNIEGVVNLWGSM